MVGEGAVAQTVLPRVSARATIGVEWDAVTKPLPAVTLKAVVLDLGGKTKEGEIVRAVAEPWFDILKMLEQDPSIAYQMNWRKWEEMVAGAYTRAGYDKVELTPPSGDKGRDVIATKWGHYSIRIFDQVKAYKPGLLVDEGEVWKMLGILERDRNVSKGYITTTSDFAPGVWKDENLKLYIPHRLELKPFDALLAWLKELSNSKA